jgi:2-dehydro-3-deoxygluconokinase
MRVLLAASSVRFDVVCVGEPTWRSRPTRRAAGVVDVAGMLSRAGLRVGLVTVIPDDIAGRRSIAKASALGIDVGGVTWQLRGSSSLVLVDARGEQTPARLEPGTSRGAGLGAALAEDDAERVLEIPANWSSDVLVLSGLSPVTARAGALCRAARTARRAGAMVFVDVNASLHPWIGRDARMVFTLLREADVVRTSVADLAVLGVDASTMRRVMRNDAVLAISDASAASVTAVGSFGEVRVPRSANETGDACMAAMCVEHLRPSATLTSESAAGRWHRILSGRSPRSDRRRA